MQNALYVILQCYRTLNIELLSWCVTRRYIYLFIFASCSSIIVWSSVNSTFATRHETLYPFFIIFDHIVNALCLWLQFGYTQSWYDRMCKYPDLCCRWCLSLRMTRWQTRHRHIASFVSVHSVSPSMVPTSTSDAPDLIALDSQSAQTEIWLCWLFWLLLGRHYRWLSMRSFII